MSPRWIVFVLIVLSMTIPCSAQSKSDPDTLVLSNGDTLHGKFIHEIGGTIIFHCDPLGDLALGWDNIKELKVNQDFSVLDKNAVINGKKHNYKLATGTFEVANQIITPRDANGEELKPLPVKDAPYILDPATVDRQVYHSPSFFAGWNGAATAGATLVTATQNQYTVSGALALSRTIPTLSWFNPSNRTLFNLNESYGKITQPGYFSSALGTYVPEVITKSSIFHADIERDKYFSPRLYALGLVSFDHNFSQDLQLQQIYGGGIGWTALKTRRQLLDLKATAQYEKQSFITGISDTSTNLIGSTFGANYALHMKLFNYSQALAFVPSYNEPKAYSVSESNTIAFPAYKNLSFSVGTLDSYLNSIPISEPPTKHNSFQFTMGITYSIKSRY